jgi:iron complex outermembrane receptor protein
MRLKRDAQYGATPFNATQQTLYLDGQYAIGGLGSHSLLVGATFNLEEFTDRTAPATAFRSYSYSTVGVLAQDEIALSDEITLIASGRFDAHNVYGAFLTPRISLMYRPSSAVTMRLGGGTGFKAPTIFVEKAEERGFRNAYLSTDAVAERSQSGSFDINWKTIVDAIGVDINAVAYLTKLDDALVADPDSLRNDLLVLRSATGTTVARGAEMALKLSYEEFKLSFGYTYLDATQTDRDRRYELALNPRHSLGSVFMWESEEAEMKVGLEAYWTGAQRLEDHPLRDRSPSYWITGLLVEKGFGPIRIFFNAENFLDTRQTRFEPIILGDPMKGPVETLPIYAPLEGRVFNGGIRFVL